MYYVLYVSLSVSLVSVYNNNIIYFIFNLINFMIYFRIIKKANNCQYENTSSRTINNNNNSPFSFCS